MKLSVIIPTFNRRALILQTLPTVLNQTFPTSDYEVIVVIDGSTDSTASALKDISSPVSVRVIEQGNRGQAAAMNAGLVAAKGELVLFVDDDHFCERTLLAEHAAAHTGYEGLVFGPVLVDPRSPDTLAVKWMRSITGDWLSRLEREGVRWPVDATVMPNSSMRRDTLAAAGGFDERFVSPHADTESGLRLWKKGVRFKFCPTAVTYQFYTKSTDDLVLHDAPQYGASEVLLCRKHPEFRRYSQFAGFTHGIWPKRKAREFSVRLPVTSDPFLQLVERVARANVNLGIRVFNVRKALSVYRSAVKAAGGWKQFESDYAKILPVLLYHHIGPARPGTYPSLTVEPEQFRKQMGWLKRNGYTTIRSGDWLAWCLESKPLPSKPVLLTFDDAYADLVDYAFPVLQECAFTATVFVVVGEVGGHNLWDREEGSSQLLCMSADQVRHWSAQGMEFGAHGRSHADLTTLSPAVLEEEVGGSGRDLAGIVGTLPLTFAYPFDYYNDAVRGCVEKSFRLAFTCDEGLNGLGTQPYLLHRTMVQPGDSLLDFALRVKLGWNPIQRLRARFRFRTRLRAALRIFEGS